MSRSVNTAHESRDLFHSPAGKVSGRPLLDGAADPVAAARQLQEARQPFYAQAHASVDTVGLSPKQIVDRILGQSMMIGMLANEGPPGE